MLGFQQNYFLTGLINSGLMTWLFTLKFKVVVYAEAVAVSKAFTPGPPPSISLSKALKVEL